MNSVNTSWFWTILKAATVATPPAPIIKTFPIVQFNSLYSHSILHSKEGSYGMFF
jgi:hypothetical protein